MVSLVGSISRQNLNRSSSDSRYALTCILYRVYTNTFSVSTTSVTGAIEMTSGPVDDLTSRDEEKQLPIKIEGNDIEPVPIPVGFQDEGQGSSNLKTGPRTVRTASDLSVPRPADSGPWIPDKDSSSKASSAPESRADEAETQNDDQADQNSTNQMEGTQSSQPKPNLLESIFGSVKSKTGSISLAGNQPEVNESSLTEVTQMSNISNISPPEEPMSNQTDSVFTEEPPSSMDAMSMLIDSIKKQTEEKMNETQATLLPPTPPNEPVTQPAPLAQPTRSIPDQLASIIGQRPEAPGTDARVLIFGDEIISKLDQCFMENTYSTEVGFQNTSSPSDWLALWLSESDIGVDHLGLQ